MSALTRWLARLLPAALSKRLGASAWGEKPTPPPEQLKAENLQLWAQSGARCWLGELVPASADFLFPEFTLAFRSTEGPPPRQETSLVWNLHQGASRCPLSRRHLSLSGQPLRIRGAAVPLQNARLFPHPGRYSLVASIANQDVARFPFRLVGDPELGQQVKVSRVDITAEKSCGQLVPGLKVLRCQEHQAVLPSVTIVSSIAAPNSLVQCSVQTLRNTMVLGCEEFMLPLDRLGREIKLRRMEIRAAGTRGRTKPTRFTLAVYVAGDLKSVTPFLLLPADRISNAEGQLTEDADALPLDDLEYEQIMNSLALPLPPLAPRRRWR